MMLGAGDGFSAKERKYVVLADHGDAGCFPGVRRVINSPVRFFGSGMWRLPVIRWLRMFIVGTISWIRTFEEDSPKVVVTYGSGAGFVLAFWQMLFLPFRRPLTHLVFDLLMDRRRAGPLAVVDDVKSKIFNTAIAKAVIWGKDDVHRFAEEFGLKEDRLVFHPYHITLDDIQGFQCDPGDDGFVFCGGNVGRDFESVIEAVGPLGIPLRIATQVPGVAEMASRYPNVEVGGVSPTEFRRLMARSTFVVEAHPRDFFRTAGHQTMLNAHYLGKPVVLADRGSAAGYVRDGIDGRVLDAGDIAGIREAVRDLWTRQNLREQLGQAGRRKAHRGIYGTLAHMQSVYNLAIREDCRRKGVSFAGKRIEIYGGGEDGR